MKRSIKRVRLNSEFKQVQLLPLLSGDRDGFPAGRIDQAKPGQRLDGLVLTEGGRCGAELHPIQCTKSC
jgi:hypothetical protein